MIENIKKNIIDDFKQGCTIMVQLLDRDIFTFDQSNNGKLFAVGDELIYVDNVCGNSITNGCYIKSHDILFIESFEKKKIFEYGFFSQNYIVTPSSIPLVNMSDVDFIKFFDRLNFDLNHKASINLLDSHNCEHLFDEENCDKIKFADGEIVFIKYSNKNKCECSHYNFCEVEKIDLIIPKKKYYMNE